MWLLYIALFLAGTRAFYEIVFYFTHRNPLDEENISELAAKRRLLAIKQYFSYIQREVRANPQFKSSLKPEGKLYKVNEEIEMIPCLIAAVLKGKKHEWIIAAFERDKKIEYLWANKGNDNSSASLAVSFEELMSFAKENRVTTVFMFHNHPNSNPQRYNCTKPSQTDLNTAKQWEDCAKRFGLNLLEFVCERGLPYRYAAFISESFMPVETFVTTIRAENNVSASKNYALHKEMRRLQKQNIIV